MARTATMQRPKRFPRGTTNKVAVQTALESLGIEATPKTIEPWLSARGMHLTGEQISKAKHVVSTTMHRPVRRLPKGANKRQAVHAALTELEGGTEHRGSPPAPDVQAAARTAVPEGEYTIADLTAAMEFVRAFPDIEAAQAALSTMETYLNKVRELRVAQGALEDLLSFQLR